MKQILSSLLVLVIFQMQAHALSGGPDFGTDQSGAAIGVFAGVLLPKGEETSGLTASTSNSLGVFAFSSPSVGLATGAFTYFDSGATYVGTITGLIDPKGLRFRALVRGTFSFFEQFSSSNTTAGSSSSTIIFSGPSGFATGSVDAKLKPASGSAFLQNSLAVRIEGEADLDVQAADPTTAQPIGVVQSLKLRVDGFKQSTDASGLVDMTALNANTTSTTVSTGSGGG